MIRPRSKRTEGRGWVTPRRDGPRSCSSQAASLPRSSASAVRNTTVPPGSRAAVFARDRQRAALAIPVYRSAGATPALAQASWISSAYGRAAIWACGLCRVLMVMRSPVRRSMPNIASRTTCPSEARSSSPGRYSRRIAVAPEPRNQTRRESTTPTPMR